MSDINLLAVLAGIIATGVLSALWYSPLLFLGAWARAAEREPTRNATVYGMMLLTAVVSSAAFGWWAGPEPSIEEAVLDGLVVGVFFAATTLGLHYAFAGRGLKLWIIDGGFEVARFVLLGVVFGLMG